MISNHAEFSLPRIVQPRERLQPWQRWVVTGVLFAALLLRVVLGGGCQGGDDVTTWALGTAFTRGHVTPLAVTNPITALRVGPAAAASLAFLLFGNSEPVSLVYPMLTSLAGILLVFSVTRFIGCDFWISVAAAMAVALNSIDIHCATTLLPDGPAVTFGFTAFFGTVFLLLRDSPPARPLLFGRRGLINVLFGALLYWVVPNKESGVSFSLLLFVVLAGIWVRADSTMRARIGWTFVALSIGATIVAAAEHLFFYYAYGDPLYRWKYLPGAYKTWKGLMVESDRWMDGWPAFRSSSLNMWVNFPQSWLLLILAAVGAVTIALVRRGRDLFSLLCIAFLVLLCIGAYETTSVIAFDRRRYLGAVYFGTIILAGILGTGRNRWWNFGIAAAAVGVCATMGFRTEWSVNRLERSRLTLERSLSGWVRTNHARNPGSRVVVEAPTYATLFALNRFQSLSDLGVAAMDATGVICDGSTVVKDCSPGSLVLQNHRRPFRYLPAIRNGFLKLFPEEGWEVKHVFWSGAGQDRGAFIFRVPEPSELQKQGGSGQAPESGEARSWGCASSTGQNTPKFTVGADGWCETNVTAGTPLKLSCSPTLRRNGDAGAATSPGCRTVYFAFHLNRPDVAPQKLLRAQAMVAIQYRSRNGPWQWGYVDNQVELFYTRGDVFGSFRLPVCLDAVTIELTLFTPGRYRVSWPRVDALPESMVESCSSGTGSGVRHYFLTF